MATEEQWLSLVLRSERRGPRSRKHRTSIGPSSSEAQQLRIEIDAINKRLGLAQESVETQRDDFRELLHRLDDVMQITKVMRQQLHDARASSQRGREDQAELEQAMQRMNADCVKIVADLRRVQDGQASLADVSARLAMDTLEATNPGSLSSRLSRMDADCVKFAADLREVQDGQASLADVSARLAIDTLKVENPQSLASRVQRVDADQVKLTADLREVQDGQASIVDISARLAMDAAEGLNPDSVAHRMQRMERRTGGGKGQQQ